jgi:hypothetical protein
MRAREILDENYNQSLESDLDNLLVRAKASGAQEMSTEDLVLQLNGMGYSVSSNSIMQLLARNPVVLNATPSMVKFTSPDGVMPGAGASNQDNAARVRDMAQKATKLG